MPRRAYAVFFSRAALRRMSLIRPCQPGPCPRKWSMMSGSNRRDTSFFGASDFGLPRRMSLPPRCRSARSNHSFVNSGASSGSTHLLAPVFFFFGMTKPHRDNVPRIIARGPYDHYHPGVKITRRDNPVLAVINTIISLIKCFAGKYRFGIGKVQAAFLKRDVALRRVEGDLHRYNVATENAAVNIFVATENRAGIAA